MTFAQQDALKHDPVLAPGAGFVSLFDANGAFIRRIASQGTLNAPWGVTIAPATFGSFPGALLVGNFGDGTINAFDLTTGAFLGQLKDSNGAVITNPSLWELLFDPSGTHYTRHHASADSRFQHQRDPGHDDHQRRTNRHVQRDNRQPQWLQFSGQSHLLRASR